MSNSYAQAVLRTADTSEALAIVGHLLGISDTSELEVDFEFKVDEVVPESMKALLPGLEWWSEADEGPTSPDGRPSARPLRARVWSESPDKIGEFLDFTGGGLSASVRWDFTSWPSAPEVGLDICGTRGSFMTLCVNADDLYLDEPGANHTLYVHTKYYERERIGWLAAQVHLSPFGPFVMAPT